MHGHGPGTVGAVVNPGALMIAGWSLRDALASYASPWVEVRLGHVWAASNSATNR
ncbi:type II 3-dehydroquinate dehydratase [Streptomyces sp. NPDC047071]|uniref:type II 3-dehydroquinate dehydratase n=1 Tax=Streptomyces sp. NPDC047071 TaxID=3154808 RepID=UPI003455D732